MISLFHPILLNVHLIVSGESRAVFFGWYFPRAIGCLKTQSRFYGTYSLDKRSVSSIDYHWYYAYSAPSEFCLDQHQQQKSTFCGLIKRWMLGRLCTSDPPKEKNTHHSTEGSADLTGHLSFSPGSSEENSRYRICGYRGKRRVSLIFFTPSFEGFWVGFLSRFIAATFFARTPFFPPCAFTHSDTDWMEIESPKWSEEIPAERRKRRGRRHPGGPRAGWGSSLCCWSGCHITPCGDDCAIYCLAGAGNLRQWNQTGSEDAGWRRACLHDRSKYSKKTWGWMNRICDHVKNMHNWNIAFKKKSPFIKIKLILIACVTWICVSFLNYIWDFKTLLK